MHKNGLDERRAFGALIASRLQRDFGVHIYNDAKNMFNHASLGHQARFH